MKRQYDAVDPGAIAVLIAQQTQMTGDVAAMRAELAKVLTRVEVIDAERQAEAALHGDHENRLRLLERWKYALPTSVLLGLGSAITVIVENWPHK